MRVALAPAIVGSLVLHALMMALLPLTGVSKRAESPSASESPPRRLQVRVLAPDTAVASVAQPSADVEARSRTKPAQSSVNPPSTAARSKPALTTTVIALPGEPADPRGSGGVASSPAVANPDSNAEPRVPTPPLNLSIPSVKLPPRTPLQTTIEQQAIRPNVMARSFERVLEQTAPVTTEITQTMDASGNVTVKVRTAGGTYCLKNSTPAGATLYDLKTLAGNCPR